MWKMRHRIEDMRLDLLSGGDRPWPLRLALKLAKARLGVIPGPTQILSYRPNLLPGPVRGYILRGMAGHGEWSPSEAELFAAYISNLNTCHF